LQRLSLNACKRNIDNETIAAKPRYVADALGEEGKGAS